MSLTTLLIVAVTLALPLLAVPASAASCGSGSRSSWGTTTRYSDARLVWHGATGRWRWRHTVAVDRPRPMRDSRYAAWCS